VADANEAEHRWRASGLPEDEVRWLSALCRAGSRARVELAATLGHEPARLALGPFERWLRCDDGRRIDLTPEVEVTVGRDPSVEVHIPDPRVSRKHCVLKLLVDGTLWVRDLGSKNRCTVDGREFQVGTLHVGQTLSLGWGSSAVTFAGSGPTLTQLPLASRPGAVTPTAGFVLNPANFHELSLSSAWLTWLAQLGPQACMLAALGIADSTRPEWLHATPEDTWAQRLADAAEAWLADPSASAVARIEQAAREDPLEHPVGRLGRWDGDGSLAHCDAWAYKGGIPQELSACYGVRAPGRPYARGLEVEGMQQALDGAAYCSGRERLEASLRARLLPVLFGSPAPEPAGG
jgi:hypothetical protein